MPETAVTSLFKVRVFEPEDMPFVTATFLRGLYYGFKDKHNHSDSFFGLVPKDIFMQNYKIILENLLVHPQTVVLVACLKSQPDFIVGYSILSTDLKILHWVHVKSTERQKGVAKLLVPEDVESVSHLSRFGLNLLPKLKKAVFNPFINLQRS